MIGRTTAVLVAALLAHGCANVYEGIQSRNDSLRTPAERATSPAPQPYDQYEAERKKLEKR